MASKLKVGDKVLVMAGNSKGKRGKILSKKGNMVCIEAVNKRKKHRKKSQGKSGSIVEFEAPIHISSLAYFDGKARNLFFSIAEGGEKDLCYIDDDGKKRVVRRIS